MSGLKKMLQKALGGKNPEDLLADFKAQMHQAIHDFKHNPESRDKLQRTLQSIVMPIRYFNLSFARPHLADREALKRLAEKANIHKIELKRILKLSLELEEKLDQYFGDQADIEQLSVTLRKVINALDEQMLTDIIDAIDHHIDFGKIERAQIDYQEAVQKAYNAEGLNRELNGIFGSFFSNMRHAFNQPQSPQSHARPSDRETEVKMLEPQYQNAYDHYREEGYTHEEAMNFVKESQDVHALPQNYLEAYRILRQEGKTHDETIFYIRNLADKSHGE